MGNMHLDGRILDRLYETIESRRSLDPDSSYTAALSEAGTAGIARKIGEESIETIIEALAGNRDRLVAESADLLYHLLVLWAVCDVQPDRVWACLKSREKRPRARNAT